MKKMNKSFPDALMVNVENSQNQNQLEYRQAVYKIGLNVSISIEKCMEIVSTSHGSNLSVTLYMAKHCVGLIAHARRLCRNGGGRGADTVAAIAGAICGHA